MTEPTSPADRMLAEIRDFAATLPTRCPTTLRVALGVHDELKRDAKPAAGGWASGQLPLGMTVVEDATYLPGQWRIFDQWDDEISAGVLPVVGATVSIKLADGSRKDMRVLTVRRDEHERIVEYMMADPALMEISAVSERLFPQYLPGRFFW
jgi:hypothetical protein